MIKVEFREKEEFVEFQVMKVLILLFLLMNRLKKQKV